MVDNRYEAPFFFYNSAEGTPTPEPESGSIFLYKDSTWSGQPLKIITGSPEYPDGVPFSFSGTGYNDKVTWIAYNLPVGYVCTLTEHVMKASGTGDFSKAGRCVDLIGTGKVETVSLASYSVNDKLSAGICRSVDLSQGWFQIFEDGDCKGIFNTIFAEEWDKVQSLKDWWIDKKASSVNTTALLPPQKITLSDSENGTGTQVTVGASNPFGNFEKQSIVNLNNSGMADRAQSFQFSMIQPVRADIQTVSTKVNYEETGTTYQNSVKGRNSGTESITDTVTVAEGKTTTTSTTTTLEYSMSATVTAELSIAEVTGPVTEKENLTVSFSVTSSASVSKQYTVEDTVSITEAIEFTVPKMTIYTGTAAISIYELPLTNINTTGTFYYDTRLPGAVKDPNSGLYALSCSVSVNVVGSVGTRAELSVDETPINH